MSIYKHDEFRKMSGLNYRNEYVIGLLQEFGDLKTSTVCTLAKAVYKRDSCIDALEGLRNEGFVQSYKASSKKVSTFNMWSLTSKSKYYLQQVKEIYGSR